MKSWISEVSQLTQAREDHIIVTLVNIKGSAPQIVSSKMLVTSSGLHSGTVGGGKIENHCIEYAKKQIKDKNPSCLETWNLQTDIGMTCGGEVSLFFDCNYFSNWTVAIFGAGHISQELTRVLSTWSCSLKVIDNRQNWLDMLPEGNNIEKIYNKNMSEEVQKLPSSTYLICMTQGHGTDIPVLTEALNNHELFDFYGVIGSSLKSSKIKNELKLAGISDLAIEKLRCPLGLEIGNNTPPEISISIAAQLLTVRKKITESNQNKDTK
jgi:xanthine dehydrogenase accessory factor